MTGITHSGIAAYGKYRVPNEKLGASPPAGSAKESPAKEVKTEYKEYTSISPKSSLVPTKTDYGFAIGDVKLSDKAKDYYEKLKSKFHNMEFIAVSNDMKEQVKKNAASYGNANKMVVLIDVEKIERMAEDENFRKKYEGIIAMSQTKLAEAKNSLTSSGAAVSNFGISVDSNGNEKFFATLEKSSDMQKKRIEKNQAEKKEAKKAAEKKAKEKSQKEALEEKIKEKRAESAASEKTDNISDAAETEAAEEISLEPKEYIKIEADSMDALLNKVRNYSYNSALSRVKTEAELSVGTAIDFKG